MFTEVVGEKQGSNTSKGCLYKQYKTHDWYCACNLGDEDVDSTDFESIPPEYDQSSVDDETTLATHG